MGQPSDFSSVNQDGRHGSFLGGTSSYVPESVGSCDHSASLLWDGEIPLFFC